MAYRSNVAALLAALAVASCGEGGTDPDDGIGDDAAARFEELADSVDGEGWTPTADALRHAATIVRLAGGATPVTLTVDGEARPFHAVAEQIDFPNIVCNWPDSTVVEPGDSVVGPPPEPAPPEGEGGCEQVGVWSMRTLIAWEPDEMAEVVRIVTDLGNTEVQPGVPDVMTGLPTSSGSQEGSDPSPVAPDSAVGEFPGFLGEYLVENVGVFFAVEGEQSNDLTAATGACTDDTVTFDWARFDCRGARFRFEFDMRVDALRTDPLPSPAPTAEETHDLAMVATEIAGVRLEVTDWQPPAPPPVPVDPPPVDSAVPQPPPAPPTPVSP